VDAKGSPKTKPGRLWVSMKIKGLIAEGKPQRQAVAEALSIWRRGKLHGKPIMRSRVDPRSDAE